MADLRISMSAGLDEKQASDWRGGGGGKIEAGRWAHVGDEERDRQRQRQR